MSEVIQPAPGQTVITTDNHHRHHDNHHHDGRHGFDAVEARADFRSLTAEVERFGTINGDRINGGVQVTGDRINAVGAAGALAAGHTDQLVQTATCGTDRLVQGGFAGVHDRLCDAKAGIVSAVDRGFAAEALADCKLGDEIADSKLFNAVQFKDQVIEANKNAAAVSNLISTVAAASNVLATSIGNAASVQATANYNGLTVLGERIRAELGAKQDAGFAAATLVAFQNKADSDAKAAACCCELKALIIEQNTATRAQAADFRMRDLESRLAATQRLLPVTIPVGAG